MSTIDLLTGSFAQAIGWALLHLLWQATIVAALLAAVLALIPRAQARLRYAAAIGALALVFALFAATVVQSFDSEAAPISLGAQTQHQVARDLPLSRVPAAIAASAAEAWRDRALDAVVSARQSIPTVVALWFVGVVLLSSRLGISWLRARRMMKHEAVTAGAEWQQACARIASAMGLRRAIRLLESGAIHVPAVIGALRPVILLPTSTLTGLSPQQIEMVLAHELAHIRRHDFLVNLLQALAETLMFHHPAVWWISHTVRVEREHCCDDLALAISGDRVQYARALARLEELRSAEFAVAVAANGGSLIERIRRIAGARAESTSLTSRWVAAVAMLSLVAIAVAVPSFPALAQKETPAVRPSAATVDVKAAVEPADTGLAVTEEEQVAVVVETELDSEHDYDYDFDYDYDYETDHEYEVAAEHDLDHDFDFDFEDDFDFDFDFDHDFDLEPGMTAAVAPVPPTPAMAPVPMVAPAPRAPRTPRVPGVAAIAPPAPPTPAAMAFAMFDSDDERADRDARRTSRRDPSGKLSVDELIELRALGVRPEDVNAARTVFPEATLRDVAAMRAVGVTPSYVSELRAAGIEAKSVREVVGLKALGVSADYIRSMRALGLGVTSRDVSGLKALGVSPEYVRGLRDAGVDVKTSRDATSLKAVGVTPEFVRKLASAGYANLSIRELTRLAAVGIDDDFIRDMEQYRNRK